MPSLLRRSLAEALGTFALVFIGVGSVAAKYYPDANYGLFGIATAHALGASGAFEAAICALASRHGWLPPTVNLETPDPACDLPMVTGEGQNLSPEVLLSNSFGFGGINAALVFRRADA